MTVRFWLGATFMLTVLIYVSAMLGEAYAFWRINNDRLSLAEWDLIEEALRQEPPGEDDCAVDIGRAPLLTGFLCSEEY